MVPVNDIADTLGRKRDPMQRLISRDAVLSGMSVTTVTVATDGKSYETTCLPYEGVLLLLAKLNASRSRTAEARDFLIEFQKWAAQTLRSAIMGEPITRPTIDRRPKLSGAWIQRTREQVGFTNTTEAMIRIWPEWFANLPGPLPNPPQQVVQPTLGLTEPIRLPALHPRIVFDEQVTP
jgi:hypothetical protein